MKELIHNMSQADSQEFNQHDNVPQQHNDGDSRTEDEKNIDKQLAERLSSLIEDANSRVIPLCKMIRKVSWTILE